MLRNIITTLSIALLFSLSLFLTKTSVTEFQSSSQSAAVFFADNIKTEELVAKYAHAARGGDEKVKIFIMPGHEPDYGGAEYRSIKERELNTAIARYLGDFFKSDAGYEVVIGRDNNGWYPDLGAYFDQNKDEIKAWKDSQAGAMKELVSEGEFELVDDPVPHQKVPEDVALRLYGINKWIGENGFDMALHIHVNDYGGRKRNRAGEFTGYTIYIPESQYSNSKAAKEIALALGGRFSQMIAVSDAKRESSGIVEDQNLVALGRYNTADAPSVLIEYGYIYEAQFQDEDVRDAVLKEYAYQTYLGVKDFFVAHGSTAKTKDSASLPYTWDKEVGMGEDYSLDVLALQIALWEEGFYPPASRDFRSCPLTGIFGGCTKMALDAFQKKYSIKEESGRLGEATRAALESAFGK